MVIFVISILFLTPIIFFLVLNTKKSSITKTCRSNPGNHLVLSKSEIVNNLAIPEPTRSLLWITDADTDQAPTGIVAGRINGNLTESDVKVEFSDDNFVDEPSLIWIRLPVEKNDDVETEKMYFPGYSRLEPHHRYQYLSWLRNIEQPTNLSYVFLYYYGLERHLMIGNYDGAVNEIIRLLSCHNKGSISGYATTALIVSSLYRKRMDILDRAPFLLAETSNEALVIRLWAENHLGVEDIIRLASQCGFKNKRYLKLYPDEFKLTLKIVLEEFIQKNGQIFDCVDVDKLTKKDSLVFANFSIPSRIRQTKVQQIIEDKIFLKCLNAILSETHQRLKISKSKSRKIKT